MPLDVKSGDSFILKHNHMKIIDTFTFFNELTLLDLRLNILGEYVDEFILVESTRSHQNKPKPLFYQENKHLFEKYNHKIKHVIVDTFPEHTYWSYEAHQRDSIMQHVQNGYNLEDIIFVSDLDEIWNPVTLMPQLVDLHDDKIYKWQSLICYFFFNLVASPDMWVQPMFIRYSLLMKLNQHGFTITNDILRNNDKRLTTENVILPGLNGWHFSYTEDPVYKLQNFLHSEYSGITQDQIQDAINAKINPFHRNQMKPIPEKNLELYLPEHVFKNIEKYKKYIYTP